MAGWTLTEAQAQLAAWMEASIKISQGQSYEIDTGNGRRKLTRANAEECLAQIKFWNDQVLALTPAGAGGRRRTRYMVNE